MITAEVWLHSGPPPMSGTSIAVGNDNIAVILRSTDGATYNDVTPSLSPDLYSWGFNCVATDGTTWVVGGFGPSTTNAFMRSVNDGLTWAAVSAPTALTTSINSIISLGVGVFLACDQRHVFKSTDSGATWSEITTGFSFTGGRNLRNLATDGAGVVLVSIVDAQFEGYGISEDDGATWTQTDTGIGFEITSFVSYANGNWILSMSGSSINYSADPAPQNGDWTQKIYASTTSMGKYVWDGTQYFAIGSNGQMKTTNLATEPTYPAAPDRKYPFDMAVTGSTTYLVNDFPQLANSTGGSLIFTDQSIPTLSDSYELWGIAFAP